MFASLTRRALAASLIALTAAAALPASAAPTPRGELFYIGSQGEELRAARLDPVTGALSAVGPVAKVNRPFWSVRHPRLPILYTAADINGAGAVIAYRIDRRTGALTRLGETPTGGGGATNLALDPASRTLFAANYGGGSVASIAIRRDGTLGERLSLVKNTGTGPHPRQSSPHAHGVILAPGGRFALVADLGADRVFVYPFDRKTGRLSEPATADAHFAAAPGSGPRHLAAHPNGRFIYLVNELTATVDTFAWNGATGKLTLLDTQSTDAPGFTGTRSAAELQFGPGGRFLYVSSRSDGALLVYRADPRSGRLTRIQRIGAEGRAPWAFDFSRTGRWLVVAQQAADRLVVFRINPRTGLLAPTGQSLASPKPVAVTFSR